MKIKLNRKSLIALTALAFCAGITLHAQDKREWGKWDRWGDLGNGTYLNPVIPADYSDLDCIRVGDDYYAITSTFQFSPGMTIIHSTDLVNWRIVGNAVPDLTQIGEALNWTKMDRPARGIWAGTLRHHNGRFYLFFGTPDEGYFMTSASAPEGPWEPLTCLLAENGWDDCTVMWDDDGTACFVGTCFKDNYKTYMFPMTPDGKKIDRSKGVLLNEGWGREANKLIKVGDWYYLVFSEHRNGIGRYVMAKRAKKMLGPYDEEKQLAHASADAHEPNQGGIVEGRDGKLTITGSAAQYTGIIFCRDHKMQKPAGMPGKQLMFEITASGSGELEAGFWAYDRRNVYFRVADRFKGFKLKKTPRRYSVKLPLVKGTATVLPMLRVRGKGSAVVTDFKVVPLQ